MSCKRPHQPGRCTEARVQKIENDDVVLFCSCCASKRISFVWLHSADAWSIATSLVLFGSILGCDNAMSQSNLWSQKFVSIEQMCSFPHLAKMHPGCDVPGWFHLQGKLPLICKPPQNWAFLTSDFQGLFTTTPFSGILGKLQLESAILLSNWAFGH